ncbi:L-piperidine-6-carboxylate dehydrogenase [Bythopirellula goksoeyrii]|uniref:Succinate-semialdehyde dehydrogenase [NADP(+)] n=1 Tax=Bythopirellula goksoeyrii TaxID=1400387 RepID=A0A5B9Q8S9_9BACT|nr:aldehyde dehydrogenase family protein [Bythopirellula goksoeyrii]QEG34089.1 Succinate-semialdehyde dehydrogenase [NADP(+)] [Bythopirellula goksoeyrii]
MHANLQKACDALALPKDHKATAIGNQWQPGRGDSLSVESPIDGQLLAKFKMANPPQVEAVVDAASAAFLEWRSVPAPVRGEFVRQFGQKLREFKEPLATLVSWEAGKITQEALGEVQEMIDVCDFAVGLSRQLYGKTIASERPGHRLTEQWHPLGPVGVISAFNFPVAVWAWNAAIAWACGDPVVWKPSEKTPLAAIACHTIATQVLAENPDIPAAISSLLIGGADVGHALASSPRLPLISATGSVPMGRAVAQTVASRLGRSLLELGGNNGMIVAPSADLDLAIRSITFSAVGTCGQRCTSMRRAIVHESLADTLRDQLLGVYKKLPIGDPTVEGTLIGPLIDERAFEAMETALAEARGQGGVVHGGGRETEGVPQGGFYVRPAIVEIDSEAAIVQQETFAPILYFMRYQSLEDAVSIHNSVPQGLSSAIITNDVREAELFCSPVGSDCGIANVNIGTSGAEIGGAFGGEKETGGGRESGSDSWKLYMRRATNTINYSEDLPLAQGIRFDI